MKRLVAAGCLGLIVYSLIAWRVTATAAAPDNDPLEAVADRALQRLVDDATATKVSYADADPPVVETPIVRVHNVTQALAKIRKQRGGDDPSEWLKHYLRYTPANVGDLNGRLEVTEDPDFGTDWRVTATPTQHTAFAEVLEGLSLAGEQQVITSSWLLTVPQIEALGPIDWKSAIRFRTPDATKPSPRTASRQGDTGAQNWSQSYGPYLSIVLSADQTDALLQRVQANPRVNVLSTPRVTTLTGQRAFVSDASQRPFVLGIDRVTGEFGTAHQPLISVFDEGLRFDVRALVQPSGEIDLDCQATLSRLDKVDVIKLPGEEVFLQAPQVTHDTVHARETLAPGESLLLAPRITPHEGQANANCVLVQPSVVQAP